ncbi:hypothetical protein BD560DRAFT_398930 [Blakeslea trispora]|nr:hypothetical protein BD560DRAFT_398930 [Blakeslea trispora]
MTFHSYPGSPFFHQEYRYQATLRPPPPFPPTLDRPQFPYPFQPQSYNQLYFQSHPTDPDEIQAIYEAYVYQIQRDREEQEYHYHRKELKGRKSKLHKSKSTETLGSFYKDSQPDYNNYLEEHHYQNRTNNNLQASPYFDSDSWRIKVDGEPMNDREKLAAENATINEKQSKYFDSMDNNIKTDNIRPSTDLPDIMSSLSLEDNSLCTTNDQISSTEPNVAVVQHSKKKKSWLLRFFSKRNIPDYFLTTSQQNASSLPPTPTLTPDNSSTSSGNSLYLIDPLLLENGIWAFQLPASTEDNQKWYVFQQANQKTIMRYVHQFNHPRGIGCNFRLFDKQIGGGSMPLLVAPFYMKCYYATDLNPKKIVTIEIRLFQNTQDT